MQLSQENKKAQKETSILSRGNKTRTSHEIQNQFFWKNGGSEFWLGFLK